MAGAPLHETRKAAWRSEPTWPVPRTGRPAFKWPKWRSSPKAITTKGIDHAEDFRRHRRPRAALVGPDIRRLGRCLAEFAKEVETGCLAATGSMLENATAVVDPFGSENYGLAIVSGEVGEGKPAAILCVFDKKTKAVEIGGELDVMVMPNE